MERIFAVLLVLLMAIAVVMAGAVTVMICLDAYTEYLRVF